MNRSWCRLCKVGRGLGHCTKVQLKGRDRSSKIANCGCQMPTKLLAKSHCGPLPTPANLRSDTTQGWKETCEVIQYRFSVLDTHVYFGGGNVEFWRPHMRGHSLYFDNEMQETVSWLSLIADFSVQSNVQGGPTKVKPTYIFVCKIWMDK